MFNTTGTMMTRALQGLEDVISISIVHPVWQKTRAEEDDHKGKSKKSRRPSVHSNAPINLNPISTVCLSTS
jgi:glutathionyl-hydroquinone reductase